MKRALPLPLALVALLLAGCGESTGSTAKPGAGPAGKASPATAGEPGQTAPMTAQGEAAGTMPDDGDGVTSVNEMLGVLENLPTQDELDAAAAERITEATADSEYEQLKAEIEQELANPPAEDG